jgi:hypothetical protein
MALDTIFAVTGFPSLGNEAADASICAIETVLNLHSQVMSCFWSQYFVLYYHRRIIKNHTIAIKEKSWWEGDGQCIYIRRNIPCRKLYQSYYLLRALRMDHMWFLRICRADMGEYCRCGHASAILHRRFRGGRPNVNLDWTIPWQEAQRQFGLVERGSWLIYILECKRLYCIHSCVIWQIA